MFDIGATELLLVAIVAILVIGPKDMPMALRTAGRWIGKVRRVSTHFKSGVEAMIREAEMEEMDKKWKAQNEAIMAAHPAGETGSDDMGAQMQPFDKAVSPGPGDEATSADSATGPKATADKVPADGAPADKAAAPSAGTLSAVAFGPDHATKRSR